MSITVSKIVLHQLIKQEEGENLSLVTQLRDQPLNINAEVEQMMLQLHQGYQNKAKSYGIFQQASHFAQQLNRFLKKKLILSLSANKLRNY